MIFRLAPVFVLFLVADVAGQLAYNPIRKDIIGGTDAPDGEFPFVAKVIIDGPPPLPRCTGTLISAASVLTAAHCLEDVDRPSRVFLLFDNANIFISAFGQAIRIHPDYVESERGSTVDIAIIHLDREIDIEPVRILNSSQERPYIRAGSSALAVGWGRTEFGQEPSFEDILRKLQKVSVSILPVSDCPRDFTLCAGQRGMSIAQGDSGGPLLVNTGSEWAQVGVASSGTRNRNETAFLFGNYVQPSRFLDWIESESSAHDPGKPDRPDPEPEEEKYKVHFAHSAIGEGWISELLIMPFETYPSGQSFEIFAGNQKIITGAGRGVLVFLPRICCPSGVVKTPGVIVQSKGEFEAILRMRHEDGSVVGVSPSPVGRNFDIPVSVAPWKSYRVGYAVFNPSKSLRAQVERSLTRRGSFPDLHLPAGKQKAMFIDESFPGGFQEWENYGSGLFNIRVVDCQDCADEVSVIALEVWGDSLITLPVAAR